MRKILLLLATIALCATQVFGEGRAENPDGTKISDTGIKHFHATDTSLFSDWLHRLFVEKEAYHTPYGWHYQNIQEFAYADTLDKTYPLSIRMTLGKKGKLRECQVEGMPAECLNEELERIIAYYSPKWKAVEGQNQLNFQIELSMPGSIVPIREPRLHRWDEGMADYVESVASTFGGTRRDGISAREYTHGCLKLTYVITKEGKCANYMILEDPKPDFEQYSLREISQRKQIRESRVWRPAIFNEKPIDVRIVLEYDYSKIDVMRWNYYLVDRNK